MPRTIAASLAAVATWLGIAALARLVVTIPNAAFVFVAVTVGVVVMAGLLLPLSGFGNGSFVLLLAFVAASLVTIWGMNATISTLFIGVVVLFFAMTPALLVFTVVRGEPGRGTPEDSAVNQP